MHKTAAELLGVEEVTLDIVTRENIIGGAAMLFLMDNGTVPTRRDIPDLTGVIAQDFEQYGITPPADEAEIMQIIATIRGKKSN